MSAVNGRRVAAVVGALVADAAAQPLHWIYNEDKLNGIISDKEEVEFWTPSHNPFYHIPEGQNSCYGDQAYVILTSLVDKKGVDCEALKSATYKWFGPESPYEDPENARYTVGKEDKINVKPTLPIHRPWRHGSIKHFLSNMDAGKEDPGSETDDQIDCVLRMVPVCALYAGQPDMLDRVEDVLRVTQNSDTAVTMGLAAARILEQFILHGDSGDVLGKVMSDLADNHRNNPQELDRAVIGYLRQVQQCVDWSHQQAVTSKFHLPGSFQSALQGALTAKDYVQGVRTTIRVGGCNASRSGFIGACMAARCGLEAIPDSWRERTHIYPDVLKLAEQLPSVLQ